VYRTLALLEMALAVPTFFALRRLTAPYGRHARSGWGPALPPRTGWLLMEAPAPIVFAVAFAGGAHRGGAVPLALLAAWQLHYVYRAFLYPFLLRGDRSPIPATVVLLGAAFNVLNAWINARAVSAEAARAPAWFGDPRFVAGMALFAAGFALHVACDGALRRLRVPGAGGYAVPRGGAFEWVSCPNYLGEIAQWTGWALATWSLAGLAFAVYTAANLAPRALAHHAWYRRRFPGYPARRRALFPFVL
jgi:hypothetical protein